MPAFIFVGVASASHRGWRAPELELDPLRAGPAERVAADHVAEEVDDVSADERPRRHQPERDDAEDDATVRSAGSPRPDDQRRRLGPRARRS